MTEIFNSFSNSTKGIAFAVIAIFLISIQDTLVKILSSSELPLHQLLVMRYVIALVLFGWLVVFISSYDGLKTKHFKKHILRGLLAFGSGLFYYLALAVMPVAETVAIFFSAPLFLTIFSVLLLGETVGVHRWTATAIGFIGVLVMVRPGGDIFNPMALLVLVAAACYALSMLLARKMGSTESAVNMSFYAMITNLAAASVIAILAQTGVLQLFGQSDNFSFLTRTWIMPDTFVIIMVCAIALITVLSFHLITQAYRIAPPSLLALFEYTSMFWAILWGISFFSQYPDGWTMFGITLVVFAGAYTIARESWSGHVGHKKWFTGRALSRYR